MPEPRQLEKRTSEIKIYLVSWDDACGFGGNWKDISEIPELLDRSLRMQTVGIILKNLKDRVLIAGSWSDDLKTFGDLNIIPKGMIRGVKLLNG